MFECVQGQGGWVQKNLTTKCSGLVLGVPWQMAVEGYREKWWVVWIKVVMVVLGACSSVCERGWGQKV